MPNFYQRMVLGNMPLRSKQGSTGQSEKLNSLTVMSEALSDCHRHSEAGWPFRIDSKEPGYLFSSDKPATGCRLPIGRTVTLVRLVPCS